jgi:hypothetical protein
MFVSILFAICVSISTNLFSPQQNLPAKNKFILLKTKEEFVRYAEHILFKRYGKEKIISEKPYLVSFKNGRWTMKGTLPKSDYGGAFFIEVSAVDGTIIKLIHYK